MKCCAARMSLLGLLALTLPACSDHRALYSSPFAPSAATPGAEVRNLKPKPALHVAGEKDPLVKWDWQKRTMDAVRKLNGCDAEGTAWDKAGDLIGTKYPSKTGTPFVSLIYPGDHKYPSAPRD